MKLDLMDSGVNPYCTIVADCQRSPSYFSVVNLRIALPVVILHYQTAITILPLATVILSYDALTLLFRPPAFLLVLIVCHFHHQQRLLHALVGFSSSPASYILPYGFWLNPHLSI